MTIKMIVDECDKYELPDITDTFSFNYVLQAVGSAPELSLVGKGGGGSLI